MNPNLITPYPKVEIPTSETSPYFAEVTEIMPTIGILAAQLAEDQNNRIQKINDINTDDRYKGVEMVIRSDKREPREVVELRKRSAGLYIALNDDDAFQNSVIDSVGSVLKTLSGILDIPIPESEVDRLKEINREAVAINIGVMRAMTDSRLEYDNLDLQAKSRLHILAITPDTNEAPQDRQTRTALLTALTMPTQDDTLRQEKVPLEVVVDEIKEGAMDEELFSAFSRVENFGKFTPALASLTNFTILVANNQVPPVPSDEAVEALKRSLHGLPSTERQELFKMRTEAVRQLTYSIRSVREGGQPSRITDPETARQQHELAFLNNMLSMMRSSLGRDGAIADRIKRKNTQTIEELDRAEKPVSTVEVIRTEREVHAAKNTSSGFSVLAAEASRTGLEDMFNEVCDTFNDKGVLAADLNSLKQYLAKIDFSSGQAQGVKQYHYGVSVDGEYANVYGLKPQMVPEIDNTSKRMKQIRVLFTLGKDSSIAVLGVFERSKLADWEKRQGLGSNRRG